MINPYPKNLVDELSILAIKYHTPEILNDIPILNESELTGALKHLRRIDKECNKEGC